MRAALAAAAAVIAVLALAAPAAAEDTATPPTTATPTTTASSATTTPTTTRTTTPDAPGCASTPSTSTTTTTPTTTTSTSTAPPPAHPPVSVPDSRRVIVYYQKHYENDAQQAGYISALPLLTEKTGVNVVNLAAIHMNKDVLNLNDNAPSDPMYNRMWAELQQMQANGIAVIGMIGGAQNDTWPCLQADFDTQYDRLHDLIRDHHLDGIDLDIELDQAQQAKDLTIHIDTVIRVIDRLRADFGPDFLITASPVMAEFVSPTDDPDADPAPGGHYGVDVNELYRERGDDIAWFNMQAYCGHGMPTPDQYDEVIRYQNLKGAKIPPEKLVIAAITNRENCTSGGWIPIDDLTAGLRELTGDYPSFGGVAGWEYFNSLPGDVPQPWLWAARMRAALDAGPIPTTTPTTTSSDPSTSSSPTPPAPSSSSSATSSQFPAPVPVTTWTPTWTVAPAPNPAPVQPAPVTTDQRSLAATGVDVGSLAVVGTLTTLLGATALLARRRTGRAG